MGFGQTTDLIFCLKDIVCMVRYTWIKVERHNGVTHTFIEQKARIFDQFCLIFINGKEGMIDYREIGLFKGKRDNKMN